MGDLARTVGDGVRGLIGGSIDALVAAFHTIVAQLQVWLPGPLFPIVVIGTVGLAAWWFWRR
ncbi:MAG TPA: hypothetical protein VK831_02510 [Candidatus Deferrimicrobiaceae bacterium]|nr:hypothetical protein [Candidatus Deferrimicrobiaceae bacterium]